MRKTFICALILFFITLCQAHSQVTSYDSLKREVLQLSDKIQGIDLRMEKSHKRFQAGILVSTLGYSVTIAGGLMLGRSNDKLGQGLLIAGGATGITGTYLLTDAFRILGNKKRPRP